MSSGGKEFSIEFTNCDGIDTGEVCRCTKWRPGGDDQEARPLLEPSATELSTTWSDIFAHLGSDDITHDAEGFKDGDNF